MASLNRKEEDEKTCEMESAFKTNFIIFHWISKFKIIKKELIIKKKKK